MTKRLFTQSKIYFNNPYVVRVDHEDAVGFAWGELESVSYRTLVKQIRNSIHGTWGYSKQIMEQTPVDSAANISFNNVFGTMATSYSKSIICSYWCFKDEMDALQFRLTIGNNARQVLMWPDRIRFTIYELIEDNYE